MSERRIKDVPSPLDRFLSLWPSRGSRRPVWILSSSGVVSAVAHVVAEHAPQLDDFAALSHDDLPR